MENAELARVEDPTTPISFGGFPIRSPVDVVQMGSEIATALADVIKKRKLFVIIRGRPYVQCEGWTTCAAMLGYVAREVSVRELDNKDYEAVVELARVSDGAVIGRASAICGSDEREWKDRPRYARRSMAVTRATSKACRIAFSWIIKLAGYEATPSEEIPRDEARPDRRRTLVSGARDPERLGADSPMDQQKYPTTPETAPQPEDASIHARQPERAADEQAASDWPTLALADRLWQDLLASAQEHGYDEHHVRCWLMEQFSFIPKDLDVVRRRKLVRDAFRSGHNWDRCLKSQLRAGAAPGDRA